MTRLDSFTKMNENTRNTLMTVYSNTQSGDYAKLGVELSQQQVAFEASLSATAKLSQLSLLDYL
jgi:flagellar hook-associated protein 3 FlgL